MVRAIGKPDCSAVRNEQAGLRFHTQFRGTFVPPLTRTGMNVASVTEVNPGSTVPEAGSLGLVLMAAIGLVWQNRRRTRV